ncbi:hypothetical protein [Halolamina sp.]|jgi:phosphoribosylamine--glycine ligase|uniref:hypothetical protein n=1 Tax=Halolamina sp. TaxID=1940283 RepID=UPI000223B708|nr:Phosphoribosylglycinamide synthetase, ATP-grasp (A) domain-containing protein [halophilic archaeon DL31]
MNAKNFLFVSADAALITDLAWQIHSEGHDVKYYIEAENDKEIGDGFVPKTDDWEAEVDWADVIVFDDIWVGTNIGTGELAQELRAQGKAVVGGTPNTDHLEEDRGYAMEILEAHGVNTVEHHIFHDFDAGIQYVQENPAPYVIKPLGEVQNVKRLLYVGNDDDGGDVVDVLKAYKKAWGHRMKGFQLQRKVEGVEVAICGFFNGEEFIDQVNFNFEHKKLFPGNIGPQTGEMGTSMFWSGHNHLFEETLGKLEGWLADEGYVGSIDMNCIVNATGIYPLEFTPRFGYPTITLQEESFESPTGQFFADLAQGNDPNLQVHSGFQVCIRVVLPPFPFDDERTYDENSRNAAVVFETDSKEGVHIEDAKCVSLRDTEMGSGEPCDPRATIDGQWRVAGENGMPIVVTGKGETMREAREQCYARVDDIVMPNLYYRDDVGERWMDGEGDRLQAWDYLGPQSS